jgi:hypothetical protein
MAKERQPNKKPPTPPEVEQAQREAAVAALPANLPKYLAYKPNEDTTVAFTQLNGVLSVLDQKLRTSNHVQPHTMMQEMVLPAFLQVADWFMRSHRDAVEYAQHLASFAAEQHMVTAMPAELGNRLLEYFKTVKQAVTEINAMMSVELNEEGKMAIKSKLDKVSTDADELEHDVEEEDFDDEFGEDEDEDDAEDDVDDDFDPEDDDDDLEDDDDEDEDEDEPEPDLVDTTTGKVKPKKATNADDEPLW